MAVGKRRARDIDKGSEFGGVDGLVQPAPHEPTPREQLIAIHQRFVKPPENTDIQTWEEVPGDMRNEILPASTDQYKGLPPGQDDVQSNLLRFFDGLSTEEQNQFMVEVKTFQEKIRESRSNEQK